MKVSVVIPAYNAEAFLEEAIESVRSTNWPHVEIVIVEDGSRDKTLDVARKMQRRLPAVVRVLQHEDGRNKGASASRNLGIRESRGDLIAFLDADDRYYPRRFDDCISLLTDDIELDGVFEATDYERLDHKDEDITWDVLELAYHEKEDMDDSQDIMKRLTHSNWHTNAITVRRSVFDRCGMFNEKLRLGQDLEMWLRMSMICRLRRGRGNAPVATYRRHSSNRAVAQSSCVVTIEVYSRLLKWMRKYHIPEDKVAFVRNVFAEKVYGAVCSNLKENEYKVAARAMALLGVRRPEMLLGRRYWGNVKNMVLGAVDMYRFNGSKPQF